MLDTHNSTYTPTVPNRSPVLIKICDSPHMLNTHKSTYTPTVSYDNPHDLKYINTNIINSVTDKKNSVPFLTNTGCNLHYFPPYTFHTKDMTHDTTHVQFTRPHITDHNNNLYNLPGMPPTSNTIFHSKNTNF